jgi:predicted nucleic acid-binding protein
MRGQLVRNRQIIHNLTEEERIKIQSQTFPRSLSDVDKSVIFLAEKHNVMILSSDKAVRNYAKAQAIEYHGMLWILDRLVEFDLISRPIAILKIQLLVEKNIVYRNNMELITEIAKRIKKWE